MKFEPCWFAKPVEIHNICSMMHADIVALTEHKKERGAFIEQKDWQTPMFNSKDICLPGYNSISMHRGHKEKGGISIK